MPVDAPLLSRQRVLAAKVETTTGTAISISASDAVFNIYDAQMAAEVGFDEREGQSSLSPLPGIAGARAMRTTFSTDVVGAGSAVLPDYTAFILASGFAASSLVLSPATGAASPTTLTVGLYQDGRLKKSVGTCGSFSMSAKSGSFGRFSFNLLGKYGAPTATSIIAPSYPTVKPPRLASATFTIGGTAYKISNVEIDVQNTVALRQDAVDASGYYAAVVTGRKIVVRCDPEALAIGTKDWYADFIASTEAALSLVFDGGSNNTITFAAPKMQLVRAPQDGDRDGILTDQLEFQCNRSASGGDDELTITYT